MFQVTALDPEDPPRNKEGRVDYSKDFFRKKTSLTVSGQLSGETFAQAFRKIYTFGPHLPGGEFQYSPARGGVLDDRAGDGVRGIWRTIWNWRRLC